MPPSCDHVLNELADTTVAIRPAAEEIRWAEMRGTEAYNRTDYLRSDHLIRLRAAHHCTAILFRRNRATEILEGLEQCSTELDV